MIEINREKNKTKMFNKRYKTEKIMKIYSKSKSKE